MSKGQYDNNLMIKKRKSVRTYNDEKIEKFKLDAMKDFLINLQGPFNKKVRFKWLNIEGELNGAKLGTYGIIKGAKNYLGVAIKESDFNLEELGYVMECFILYATSLGLGTCWMGGTFKKSEFAKVMQVKEDEIFPIVTPIGYRRDKKRLIDATLRFVAGSNNRKEWSEIFFLRDFTMPITPFNSLGKYREALENVRLAPSAGNKQPWRIVKIGESFHFYIKRNRGYSDKLGFDIQRIDMGIAMCHFDQTCKEFGLKGDFEVQEPKLDDKPMDVEYVITWSRKNSS